MRHWSLVLILALAAAEAGAQFAAPGGTVPVVANNAGAAGTFWRSDVNIVNVGGIDTQVVLQLFPELVGGSPAFDLAILDPIGLAAGEQLSISNVVQTRFGLVDAKGGLRIYSNNGAPLVISSRTYTSDPSSGGTYGQDVNGVMVAREAWASGLRHDSLYRSNLGIFYPGLEPAQFSVMVYSSDGEEVGSGTISFSQAGFIQRSLDSFNVSMMIDGYLKLTCSDPTVGWFAYASRVDQISGDAVFRPARGRYEDVN
jgi:hypothetical protein